MAVKDRNNNADSPLVIVHGPDKADLERTESVPRFEVPIGRQETPLTVEQEEILEKATKHPEKKKHAGREMPTTTIEEIRRKHR